MGSGPTQATEQYFDKGLWGFDGTQWRKLPMLLGFSSQFAQENHVANATAGTNVLNLATVPAGEIWRVSSIAAFDANSVVTAISFGASLTTFTHYLATVDTPAASVLLLWSGEIVLIAGQLVTCSFYGCTLNDDLYLTACGYKMAVA